MLKNAGRYLRASNQKDVISFPLVLLLAGAGLARREGFLLRAYLACFCSVLLCSAFFFILNMTYYKQLGLDIIVIEPPYSFDKMLCKVGVFSGGFCKMLRPSVAPYPTFSLAFLMMFLFGAYALLKECRFFTARAALLVSLGLSFGLFLDWAWHLAQLYTKVPEVLSLGSVGVLFDRLLGVWLLLAPLHIVLFFARQYFEPLDDIERASCLTSDRFVSFREFWTFWLLFYAAMFWPLIILNARLATS